MYIFVILSFYIVKALIAIAPNLASISWDLLYNLSIKISIVLKIFIVSISIESKQVEIVVFIFLVNVLCKKNNKIKICFRSLFLLFIKEILTICFEKNLLFFALSCERIRANLLKQLILVLLLNKSTSL